MNISRYSHRIICNTFNLLAIFLNSQNVNTPAMKWQPNHQKHPLQLKRNSAGEISKNKAKGFSGGASAGLPGQALGLSLHNSASIALEIGSRFFVDCSQVKYDEKQNFALRLFIGTLWSAAHQLPCQLALDCSVAI